MNVEDRRQFPNREDLLNKLETLSPAQQSAVMAFIETLDSRSGGSALEQYLRERGDTDVDLEEVREQLSAIEGSMSDTVRTLRDERG